jgi:hypothetical protein
MPGLSAMVADIACAPQQSIDVPAAAGPAHARALPNLVQLLAREALRVKMTAALLNRLLDRPGVQPFSEACVNVLRSQLGAVHLSDLYALETYQITGVHGLSPDETNSLVELHQSLKWEVTMGSLSLPLLTPAVAPSSHDMRHIQQESGVAPFSESMQKPAVREEVILVASEKTLWPQHEPKHNAGKCQPCAYYFKPDSCKWGAKCDFCHLCPDGEIKTRKKEKIRVLREQAQREKNAKQNPQVVSLSLSSALNYF